MPQFERRLYDPAEDAGALDDDANEDEGSRLPLLIVIALVVLASFAGVVWLAYTQGVQRGREDAPRIIASQQDRLAEQKNPYSDLNIYKRTKPGADEKPTSIAPAEPVPNEVQSAAPTAAPASKPAPHAILPPPVPNPNTEAPLKPAATPQTNAVKPPATSLTPKPAAAPVSNPSANAPPASAIQPPTPQANGAPHAITPNVLASVPVPSKATIAAPPAGKPAPQQQAPNTQTAATNLGTTPPASAAAQSFVLQIGSYTSEAEANASWQTYKAGHPSVAGYAPDIQTADLGRRGTWYRLRVGPFASMQDAASACAKLKAQGASCLPTKR